MEEAELGDLAASAATALIRLMTTDDWPQARAQWAAFVGGQAADDLDAAREELLAARTAYDYGTARELEIEWRVRLRRRLRTAPGAAGELTALLPATPTASPGVTNYYGSGTVFQGGAIENLNITRHSSRPGATPPGPPLDDDDDQW